MNSVPSRKVFLGAFFLVFFLGVIPIDSQEWVAFEGTTAMGEKLQLTGILKAPEGEGPFPAVVMLHVCAGLKDDNSAKQLNAWSERLVDWGYVTLQVDSFGPRGYGNICENTDRVSLIERSFDAFSAKSYLTTLKYVDSKNIAAIGWSHGAWGIMALVDGIYRDENTNPFEAAIAFYPWCESLTSFDTPLLILIGEKDAWCPSSRCITTKMNAEADEFESELKLIVYPNVYHCFDVEGVNKTYLGYHIEYNPEATADAILQVKGFLAKYLKH